MWQPWQWASTSNVRAVENARIAAVACSRRLVERAEVERYLASRLAPRDPATTLERRTRRGRPA